MRTPRRPLSEIAQDIADSTPRPLRCGVDILPAKIEHMLGLWKDALPPRPKVSPAMARERARGCHKLVQRLQHELRLLPIPPPILAPTQEHLSALANILERAAGKGGFKRPPSVGTHAVECANGIIRSFSKKHKPTGNPGGPLYLISSLVYEAFTGERKRNLKHAIDAEMRIYRG
jgi:hypothetical protein